jgi:hypothetical protein
MHKIHTSTFTPFSRLISIGVRRSGSCGYISVPHQPSTLEFHRASSSTYQNTSYTFPYPILHHTLLYNDVLCSGCEEAGGQFG